MAILAVISTGFENAISEGSRFQSLSATEMAAPPRAAEKGNRAAVPEAQVWKPAGGRDARAHAGQRVRERPLIAQARIVS
jgi:hypothetical protein